MSQSNSVLILTEAGPQFGIGHWRRCQALAAAFEAADFKVELRQNDFAVPSHQYSVIVIDSYHLTQAEYSQFSMVTNCLVVIDDNNRLNYPAQMIVNPSLGATEMKYQTAAQLLAGSEFALLNSLYWTAGPVPIQEEVSAILLTLGGSAVATQVETLRQQLSQVFPSWTFLASTGEQTPVEMFELYHQADIVISGGGQTLHELACLGLPTVALKLADNQTWNLSQWSKVGFIPSAIKLTDPELFSFLTNKLQGMSYEHRQQVASIGRRHVDGRGAQRVVEWVQRYVNR